MDISQSKKKRVLYTRVLGLGLCLMMVLSLFTTAFADSSIQVKVPAADQKAMEKVFNKWSSNKDGIKLEFKKTENVPSDDILVKYSSSQVVFNMDGFNAATDKSRKAALKNFVAELQNSSVSSQTQQNVFDTIADSNEDVSILLIPLVMDSTKADLFTAMKVLAPFLQFVRVVLGIGAVLVVLALMISTTVDLVYIGIPMGRDAMDSKEGGKVPFLSVDAMAVVKEVESSLGDGKKMSNAYLLYFRRRALTYIILAICLLYLIVGELGGLIAWLLNLVSGVV